jgi:PAS domain S-box-containing protein
MDQFLQPNVPREETVSSTKGPGRPHLLITDDRPEIKEAVEGALGGRYACEFAASVEQVGEMLGVDEFDVLLCDVQAGGEPALALAKRVSGGDLDTAVVVITGKDDPIEADHAFESGVHGYVVKPPRPGQLLITVMNALRRRELEIANRKHAQNLEDRRQTIIDMAPMPIYAKDSSGRYVVANVKADELAGVEPGGLLGLTDEAIMAPESRQESAVIDRQVLDQGSVHEAEEVIEVGGVERAFKTVKFPLLDSDGQVDAVSGISIDVSAEREAGRLRDELAATQKKAIEELRLSRLETIEGLTKAIDLHDSSTAEHVNRIAAIAAFLAAELGLDAQRVELLRAAAPMHDVGKIGISAELLNKPGSLSEDERTEMMRHTVVGHEIFGQFKSELSQLAATIALTHHERFDGSGYPQGLVGEEIPLEGRITAVADVFDAVLSDRSYRPAMSVDEAVAIIREGRGTQFDPRIADVLLDRLDDVLAVRDRPGPALAP